MQRPRTLILAATSLAALAGFATAQTPPAPASAASTKTEKPWVAPGTKGSEIDGTVFHAQVLLSTAGFSTSVLDCVRVVSSSPEAMVPTRLYVLVSAS